MLRLKKKLILISVFVLLSILLTAGYFYFHSPRTLADVVGSLAGACAIVAGVGLLLGLLVYIFRHTLIMRPTASFIARIFLEKKNDTQNKQQ